MPASFPSSPTLNQIYSYLDHTWKWNGSAWQSVGTVQGVTGPQGTQGILGLAGTYSVTATAPSAPGVGSAWLNTNDGRLYVYDGTQWFEPYDNLNGIQGTQGLQGLQGTQGVLGPQGVQGFGYAQLQGTQGTTGPAPSVGKIIAMAIVFGG